MPQIPSLENQVSPRALPDTRRNPMDNSGLEQLGGAIRQVGSVVSQVEAVKRNIREEEQKKADRAAFMEADRQVDTFSNDLVSRAQSAQLKDAIGLTPKALEEFDKNAKEVEGTLTTERAKLAYRESVYQRRSQIQRSLNSHENNERERYYEKSREDYKAQAHMNAVTNYRDPGAIESEIQKIRATVDQTPGLDSEQKATELGVRASAVYAGVVERMLANEQVGAADKYYKSIRSRVNGPVAADIERGIVAAKNRLEAESKAKLTELRQSLSDQLRDIQAAAFAGIPVKSVPPRATLEAVFGKYEGGQRFDNAEKLADLSVQIGTLHTLSAGELVDKAKSFEPTTVSGAADALETARVVSQQAARILEARKKDPAGYLVTHDPAVSKAWEAFQADDSDVSRGTYLKAVRAERERLGIPGNDVLPDAYVQNIADAMSTADAQKLATVIEREGQKWGQDWPAVQGQLAGKITDTAAVISSGISRSAAVKLASTSKLKETELQALLPPGMKWNEVRDEVDETFEQFNASLPPEAARTLNAYRDSATRLSVQYMHEGMSQGNAVKKAYKDLVRDEIVEFRSQPFRVPPEENPEEVETGAQRLIETFSTPPGTVFPDGAFTAEEYASQFQDYVRKNGYWVTRPDAKGLRLYVDGGPVASINPGEPVQYTWEQIRTLAQKQSKRDPVIERRKEMR